MSDNIIEEVVQVEPAANQEVQSEPQIEPAVQAASTEQAQEQQPSTQPTAEPQTNFEWLKKHGINSEQDLESILGERNTLKTTVEELAKKEPTLPYKTDFAKVADELTARGVKPETIARFHGLKTEELSDKEAVLRKLEIEFPTLSAEERNAYYTEEYGELENPDSLLTEGAKAHKKVQLQKAANESRDYLKQFVYEALNPNSIDPELAQKEEGRQGYWKAKGFSQIQPINEYKLQGTVKLPTQNGVEEKPHEFVFQLTQEEQQALNKEFGDTVLNPAYSGMFDNTEQGVNNAKATYGRMFWTKFGEQIVQKQMEYAQQRESQIHEHYAKLMNNTSFKGTPTPAGEDKSVSADQAFAQFMKQQTNRA